MAKNLVLGLILAHLVQLRAAIFFFFFKNLAPSVTRYHGLLLSCTISEKTNERTDRLGNKGTRVIS